MEDCSQHIPAASLASGKMGSGKRFYHNVISGADFAAPCCVAEYMEPAPAVTYALAAPIVEYVTPAPPVACVAPAPTVIHGVSPVTYAAQEAFFQPSHEIENE